MSPRPEDLLGLWSSIVHDCFRPVCAKRALARLNARAREQGTGWLTRELPGAAREFDKSLATNAKTIPSIVAETLGLDLSVFEPLEASGVRRLRQVMHLYTKLRPDKVDDVPESFWEQYVDRVTSATPVVNEEDAPFLRSLLFFALDGLDLDDILPSHGPGAVAGGELPWEKGVLRRMFKSWGPYYDPSFFIHSAEHYFSHWDEVLSTLEEIDCPPSKVVLVPKDFRGPRVICAEPWENQFLQQGQWRKMRQWIECNPFTAGVVNFTTQEVNRSLARIGSLDGSFATLDLKDASDFIRLDHLRLLPERISKRLEAARTQCARLPNGRIVQLTTAFPMGAATCFPTESLLHWAICVVGVARAHGASLRDFSNRKSALAFARHSNCYVYGDDIVVRSEDAVTAMEALTRNGLSPNPQKCCIAGPFRESCGWDCFNGELVTPVRIKQFPDRRDPMSYPSVCDSISLLLQGGYFSAAMFLWKLAAREFGHGIPVVACEEEIPCTVNVRNTVFVPLEPSTFRTRPSRYRRPGLETYVPMVRPILCKRQAYRRVVEAFQGLSDEHSSLGFTVPHRGRKGMGWIDAEVIGILR